MSIRVNITETARRLLAEVGEALSEENVLKVAGRAVANTGRENFQKLEEERPNKQGFHRQHFWSGARRATRNPVSAGAHAVLVEVDKAGVALRYFGGVVKPVNAKALTIPATDEAYGKR